jgi:hypothetical protein
MHGSRVWALVNLICLIATFYLFLPVAHIRAKYRRKKLMRKVNEAKEELRELQNLRKEQLEERERIRQVALELRRQGAQAGMENTSAANLMSEVTVDEFAEAVEELYYKVKVFTRRFRAGIGIEAVDCVLALIAFILTEDMRLPMVLIDRWTPLMLVLLLICWVIDVRLVRYREDNEEENEDERGDDRGKAVPAGR